MVEPSLCLPPTLLEKTPRQQLNELLNHSSTLLRDDRLQPRWRLDRCPTHIGIYQSYYVLSHVTGRAIPANASLTNPNWPLGKIPCSSQSNNAITDHALDCVIPNWWEAVNRFHLARRAIPLIYFSDTPGDNWHHTVHGTYCSFLTATKSFVFSPAHDLLKPYFADIIRSRVDVHIKTENMPALVSLRHMTAEWAPWSLGRAHAQLPVIPNIEAVINLINEHLFTVMVFAPNDRNGIKPLMVWEYLGHQSVYARRNKAASHHALPLASGFALDFLTQMTFELDVLTATLVVDMAKWVGEYEAVVEQMMKDLMRSPVFASSSQ